MSAPMTPERIWADEDTWLEGPGRTERAVEYVRADLFHAEHEARVAAEAAQALVLELAADEMKQRADHWSDEAIRETEENGNDFETARAVTKCATYSSVEAFLRALSPASGVEALAALRKERDEFAQLATDRLYEIADAEAAQALVLERAAAIGGQIGSLMSWERRSAIRALAPASGVQALAALRDERDHALRRVSRLEAALSGGVLAKNDSAELLRRLAAAEAERDTLAAQVEALTTALHDAYAHQLAACAEWEAEMAKARGAAKHKMLAARYAGHRSAMQDLAKRIAALEARHG